MVHAIKRINKKVYFTRLLFVCLVKSIIFAVEGIIYNRLLAMDISTILKERRATLNISQQELSEMAGVSLATIKDLERGVGNPSLKTLERIAVVLGLEISITRKRVW